MNTPLWYSLWSFPTPYHGSESAFVDENRMPCSEDFIAQSDAIRNEVLTFLENQKAVPYFKQSMLENGKGYHTLSLAWWGIRFNKNQQKMPVLASILNRHPELLTLSINILEANSRILPHMGDTNATYRGHFGISIPSTLPAAGIRVKGEERFWKEGAFIWFMDAYLHETWNQTNHPRIILLVDALRPEFKARKKRICATAMTSLFLQKRIEKYRFFQRNQSRIVRYVAPALIPLVQIRIAWINFIGKY
ncbi:MAG: aspartyl/asparaginyl beta-hydroxylase domain-containing protein [Flavobacteriales bacterium]